MITTDVIWVVSRAILPQHRALTCTQVYVCLVGADKSIVIVSKDGDSWQLPGGKPEWDESMIETAVREVGEETRLDISGSADRLVFFGYYVVREIENGRLVRKYTQVRYLLELENTPSNLRLDTSHEDTAQAAADTIRYADAVSIEVAFTRIPWLKASDEFASLSALVQFE